MRKAPLPLDLTKTRTEDGKLPIGLVKSWEADAEDAVRDAMTSTVNPDSNEISGVSVTIDPDQNILSTNKIAFKLGVQPKGYASTIEVDLGFTIATVV